MSWRLAHVVLVADFLGQPVCGGVAEDHDAVELGKHRADRHRAAARVDADEEVSAPVGHLTARVADGHVGFELLVDEIELDVSPENAAGPVDLLDSQQCAHAHLPTIVGMGSRQGTLTANADRLLGLRPGDSVLGDVGTSADCAGDERSSVRPHGVLPCLSRGKANGAPAEPRCSQSAEDRYRNGRPACHRNCRK
jgi:hypothetical protein